MPISPHATDHIVRGTASEGLIRALAISATDTVRSAQGKHDASPAAAAALGRLMMAAQMMGSLFKTPGELISLMVRCTGPLGGLTVTADSEGNVKGYAENPAAQAQGVSEAIGQGALTVVRDSPHIEPYVSQIALVNGTISDDLTAYYIVSEQIPTIVGLEALTGRDGTVSAAGGYLIQLMPGYPDNLLGRLEAALSAAPSLQTMLSQGLSPAQMLEQLLAGLSFKAYEETPAAFRCDCSQERSERTLLSLGADELQQMIDEGQPIDIKCDFCSTHYTFTVKQLEGLLQEL